MRTATYSLSGEPEKSARPVLILAALVSIALLAVALYLQHAKGMAPCPLCIIQRYAYTVLAIVCLIAAAMSARAARTGAAIGMLVALAGAGVAGWHLWIKAHPDVSCGIDPMETALNHVPTANLLPFLFKADGFCTTEYAPILGLSIPQWSLLWFVVLAIALAVAAFRRR
ncbi:MAG: disulfide bond formation protein B [Burkholderiaceae bacterium]